MKKTGRLLLAGLLAFILALPLYLPAAFVLTRLADRVPHGIAWREVSGALLKPHLHSVSIDLPYGNRFVIDEMVADISLWSLLKGRIGGTFEVRLGDDRISGAGSLGAGRWQIESLEGDLKVGSISNRIPGAELAISSGQVELSGERWSGVYNAFPDRGSLQIRLIQLQSDLAGPDPLGDYQIFANTDAQGLKAEVATTNVDALLNVTATGSVNPSIREINISGTAEAKPAAPEAMRGLLPFFGAVENNRASIRISTPY